MDFKEKLFKHIEGVQNYLKTIGLIITTRGYEHDSSKVSDEEYKYFKMANSIDRNQFKTYEEYLDYVKPTLDKGLKHHYEYNRHHPEHFDNGVNDMTLIDIIEMIIDWKVSIEQNGKKLEDEIGYNFDKYNISDQLKKIIMNTFEYINEYEKEE